MPISWFCPFQRAVTAYVALAAISLASSGLVYAAPSDVVGKYELHDERSARASQSLLLKANGGYIITAYNLPSGRGTLENKTREGTYDVDGSKLTFHLSNGATCPGLLDEDGIHTSLVYNGLFDQHVYTRAKVLSQKYVRHLANGKYDVLTFLPTGRYIIRRNGQLAGESGAYEICTFNVRSPVSRKSMPKTILFFTTSNGEEPEIDMHPGMSSISIPMTADGWEPKLFTYTKM